MKKQVWGSSCLLSRNLNVSKNIDSSTYVASRIPNVTTLRSLLVVLGKWEVGLLSQSVISSQWKRHRVWGSFLNRPANLPPPTILRVCYIFVPCVPLSLRQTTASRGWKNKNKKKQRGRKQKLPIMEDVKGFWTEEILFQKYPDYPWLLFYHGCDCFDSCGADPEQTTARKCWMQALLVRLCTSTSGHQKRRTTQGRWVR